jgi:hypothetical protein
MRVQEHSVQSTPFQAPIVFPVAVPRIPADRVAGIGGMNPNLVGAAGSRPGFEEGRTGVPRERNEVRLRGLALRRDAYESFAGSQDSLRKGTVDPASAIEAALDQDQVALFHAPLAKGAMEVEKRAPALRHDQKSRSVTVEAVRQVQESKRRSKATQPLDDPQPQAAAAVHRESGRLVQHQQIGVLVHDG